MTAGGVRTRWLLTLVVVALVGVAMVAPPRSARSTSLPGSGGYRNPVHQGDFPDPFVLRSDGRFFAYATRGLAANIQIMVSPDLVTWTRLGNALPFLPEWAVGPQAWAPAVLEVGDRHVLYYTITERRTGLFCVSAAVSNGPAGPFVDRSSAPLVCQRERGGTIDPSVFVDRDGAAWLLFKSDGIKGREPTRLWSQQLGPDGLTLRGQPAELLRTDRSWEQPVIENPAMTEADGRYFLLYSANRWYSARYAVGWAACDGPAGPCHKPGDGPLISSTDAALGPGGADFFTDAFGGRWIAYHAWTPPHTQYPWGERSLRIDKITFVDGRPQVEAPSTWHVPFTSSG